MASSPASDGSLIFQIDQKTVLTFTGDGKTFIRGALDPSARTIIRTFKAWLGPQTQGQSAWTITGHIVFRTPRFEFLRLENNGKIFVKDQEIATDLDLVERTRKFIKTMQNTVAGGPVPTSGTTGNVEVYAGAASGNLAGGDLILVNLRYDCECPGLLNGHSPYCQEVL